jgi:hypothetical protein
MIQRNKVLYYSIAITIALCLTLTTEARLQGSKEGNLLTEKEEDELLFNMDKEYSMNEESKQKAHEDAMAIHNKILPTHLLLEEVNAHDAIILEEEAYIAKEIISEKEKEQSDNEIDIKVDVDSSLLASITTMNSEYEDFEEMKKMDAVRDKETIEHAKEVTLFEHENNISHIATREEEEEDKIINESENNAYLAIEEDENNMFIELEIEENKIQQQAYHEMEEQQKKDGEKFEELIKQQIDITNGLLNE